MKYHLIFFPLVGALIGGVLYGWLYLANMYGLSDISRTCIGVAIPLLITGGFHVDGFMDTMDAFSSYKGREEKLRILKDPHIGAFSVIKLVTLMLIYLAAFSEILDEYVSAYVSVFFIARALSAIAVVCFKNAKEDGMLHTFSKSAGGKVLKVILIIEAIIGMAYAIRQSAACGILISAALLITFIYYYCKTKKELGGITGDTAGYFVTIAETLVTVVIGIYSVI